jgi:NOL1/NOP2/fmu family ribosome biogenesis protein
MHRATTLPIPGQEHYAQPAYYQNNPAPGIAQRASYSGISMPEAETHGGRWSHRAYTCLECSCENA